MDEKTERKFKSIEEEISVIRNRIAVLESETLIHTLPSQNQRSEAAKKMWSRRKAKRKPVDRSC